MDWRRRLHRLELRLDSDVRHVRGGMGYRWCFRRPVYLCVLVFPTLLPDSLSLAARVGSVRDPGRRLWRSTPHARLASRRHVGPYRHSRWRCRRPAAGVGGDGQRTHFVCDARSAPPCSGFRANMKGLGRRAKHLVEQALVRSGVAFGVRTLRSSPGVILAYHNIVPRGERADGDGSLHLSADVFGQHLDALLESHDVVSLTEVTVAREGGGRPRAAITFDDAYAGAVKAGLAELRSRGLPATIFVAPGRLGRQTFWWDALADDGAVPPRVREYALEMLAGQQERVLAWAATAGIRRRVPSEVEATATEEEL